MNMATPLKKLLSPKLLSPLSPRLLSTTNSKINLTPADRNKRLNFASKPDFSISSANKKLFNNHIEVTITDYSQEQQEIFSKKDILINTPIKGQILKDGLSGNKWQNILGWGGFGKVIRAVYKGEVVALKVVKNNNQSRERNALSLCHENVVKVIDIIKNEKDNYSMVFMEYFPNSIQLQRIIEDAKMDLNNKIIKYSADICNGLKYCHMKKILHLDVKPSNILVCNTECKICDFGNSVCQEDLEKGFKYNGTVHYTAPEILLGQKPTEKCDVYSLGIVFWQMKQKKNPYLEFLSNEEIIYKVVKYCYRPEMAEPEDDFCKLYQNCWGNQPCSRPSIEDILNQLYLL